MDRLPLSAGIPSPVRGSPSGKSAAPALPAAARRSLCPVGGTLAFRPTRDMGLGSIELSSAEDRLPLLLEGARTLAGVLGLEDPPAVVVLVGERVRLGHAVRLVQRAEHRLDRERA